MTAPLHYLETPGQPTLAFRLDPARGATKGRVLLIHGYAEHSARYDRVVSTWCEHGLTVARLDLRGHGHSAGPRGHVADFDEYVGDVERWLARLEHEADFLGGPQPVLFGHSLGGLIASHAALHLGSRVCGLALTSPFFGLAKPVPGIQRLLASAAARLAPGLRQPSGLSGKDMTHDASIAAAYDSDPLSFHHVTAGWFVQVTRAQARLFDSASRFELPIFCVAGGDDHVVSVEATRRFFGLIRGPNRELDVRPGLFHEVLNEPEWRGIADALAGRMLSWSMA